MPLRPRELHARADARRGVRRLRPAAPEAAPAGPAVARPSAPVDSPRLLVVKLADLGDALTATPALRALRQTWPTATIDILTTPIGSAALEGLDSVDHLWVADKHRFDSPAGALALPALTPLLGRLRRRHYDQLLLLHHLTTPFGTAKYALLAAAIAATRTIGLDNGRGHFLDARVPDPGFGAHHEVDYALAVTTAAGATPPSAPRLEIALDPAAVHRAAELLRLDGVARAEPSPGSVARTEPTSDRVATAQPSPDSVARTEPTSDRVATAQPSPDSVARTEPTSDRVATTQPSPDRIARAESSPDRMASAEPSPNRVVRAEPWQDTGGRAGSHAGAMVHALADATRDENANASPSEGCDWVALHAGGGTYSTARRWPAESFLAAAQAIAEHARIVIVGTDADRDPHELLARELGALDLTGRTSVKETAAVLARCRLLVSNDSGVVHLAAAVGTPTVAVFGPSNDLAWGPYPPAEHRVVRASLPCSPCFYRGASLGTPEGCPTRDCLQLVTPDMVVEAALSLLAHPAAA